MADEAYMMLPFTALGRPDADGDTWGLKIYESTTQDVLKPNAYL